MAHIAPCFRCPLATGCDQRDEFKLLAKQSGALSLRFRCDKLGAEIHIGRRVVIRHPTFEGYGNDGEHRIAHVEVPASITNVGDRYEFVSVIDPGTIEPDEHAYSNPRFRRRQPHYRIIRFLEEPDAELCRLGYIMRAGACDIPEGACRCHANEELWA